MAAKTQGVDKANIDWLWDPEIFSVNRLLPCSDFKIEEGLIIKSLNGQWQVQCYDTPRQALNAFEEGAADVGQGAMVPGHLQIQGFGELQYVNTMYPWDGLEDLKPPQIPSRNLTALYRREFVLPDLDNSYVRFCLHGVESCGFVWINGHFVGYSEDSFTPSRFDITEFAQKGINQITVMVPRFCTGSWLEDQDFWRFSGIFRDVAVEILPAEHIVDLETVVALSDDFNQATVTVRGIVKVDGQELTARAGLYGQDGSLLKEGLCTWEGDGCSFSATVDSPQLWSAETPNLYTLRFSLFDAQNHLVQRACVQTGFRRIEIQDKIITLNGKRLVFRGVNRHEFSHKTGRAITAEDIENDLLLMKRNNINAVRTSHYPNNSYFYSLCDKLGLYVIDEVNLETHGTWLVMDTVAAPESGVILPNEKPEWKGAVLDRAQSMLERDKNHCCILFWSCGNESYGGETLYEMSQYFRKRDPSRLVHYEGLFNDRRFNGTSDVESRMYTRPKDVEAYLSQNPQKPFILCEYAHAMGNSFGGVNLYTELEERYLMYQGGFIWDWSDQCLLRNREGCAEHLYTGDACKKPTDAYFCANGLLFADHTPSPKLLEAKFLYAPIRINCGEDFIEIENRHLFISTNLYTFTWKLLRNGKTVETGTFSLIVPPGEKMRYALSLDLPKRGELVLECSAALKEALPWAPGGHEIAFGQTVLVSKPVMWPDSQKGVLILGDWHTGGKMRNSHALVSKRTGKLTSFYGCKELLSQDLSPEFWRAPTDNDIGAHMHIQWAPFKIASLYQSCSSFENLLEDVGVKVEMAFAGQEKKCLITYHFLQEDCIRVSMAMDLTQDMPCFGASFAMPGDYHHLKWYGNTQPEAYNDRKNAARLGIVTSLVENEYVPYARPQECANKTNLRWLEIKNVKGQGIRVFAPEPFQASVLPYTAHEIENAGHISRLPVGHKKSVIRVLKDQCGIAGDDTWGSHTHPQYRFQPEGLTTFSFYLQMI